MSFIPSHKIFASNGTSLLYTIEDVVRRDPALAVTVPKYVEYTNLRSTGSIIVPGGNQSYDITLYARLGASNYENLMIALEALQTAIVVNTRYYLKIDKSISTTEDIKVMRLQPIVVDTNRGNLRKFLYYTLTLRANSW